MPDESVFGNPRASNEESPTNENEIRQHSQLYCSYDDLKFCLDTVQTQIEKILYTAENTNVHTCIDAINLLLTIMSMKGVKGYTNTDRAKLSESLNKAIPAAKKAAFDFIFRKRDPSLTYKAKYALETLHRVVNTSMTLVTFRIPTGEAAIFIKTYVFD